MLGKCTCLLSLILSWAHNLVVHGIYQFAHPISKLPLSVRISFFENCSNDLKAGARHVRSQYAQTQVYCYLSCPGVRYFILEKLIVND